MSEKDIASIYQQAKRGVVELLVDGHLGGSGCFVSRQGLIITAAHVLIHPSKRIEVQSATVSRRPATIVATDLGHDLALLKVEPQEQEFPVLRIASEEPKVGEELYLMGTPAYRHQLIQRGMVAREDATFEYQSHFIEVLQIAAMVQEGTSGGPWLNRAGEVVGIQSGAVTVNGQTAGIANVATRGAIESLVKTQQNAVSATIGLFVDEVWILQADALIRFPAGAEGMIVQRLDAEGAAMRAGLKQGELIVEADGRKLRLRDDFLRLLRGKQPGEEILLSVMAPNEPNSRQVNVTVEKLEAAWETAVESSSR